MKGGTAEAGSEASEPTATNGRLRRLLRDLSEAVRGSSQDFTAGSLPRAVLLLAVPMMIEMFGESLFTLADAFWVAKLGSQALSAVGLTEAVLDIVFAVTMGLGLSATALVSRRYGEGRVREAARVAMQTIVMGLLLSVLMGVLGYAFAGELLRGLGADAGIVATGLPYTRCLLGGLPSVLMLFLLNAVFRGAGDAATAMRALWIGNLVNIVLGPCLIFGVGPFPKLGLLGAAVGTTIGRGVAVAYQLMRLMRPGGRLQILREDVRIESDLISQLFSMSLGGAGQHMVSSLSWLGLVRILSGFGSVALAGYVVAMRVMLFALLPAWGLSNAAATLVGQNLGAHKPVRAEQSVWLTGAFNMAFMGLVALVFIFFPRPVVSLLADEEAVRVSAAAGLRVIGYGYVFFAWSMVMLQAFNGAGNTTLPTLVNLFCFWVIQLPLGYLLSHVAGLGAQGVFWSITISYAIAAIIGIVLFRRGEWKRSRV